jgi:hypothetical protein
MTWKLRHHLKELGSQGIVLFLIALGFFLQGCGLVFDAVELVQPLARDEVSAICSRGQFPLNLFVPLYFQLFSPMKGFVSPASMWS